MKKEKEKKKPRISDCQNLIQSESQNYANLFLKWYVILIFSDQ